MSKSTGALFKNDKKGGDNHPDYRGDFKLTKELLDDLCAAFDRGADKVQLAGWKKEGRNGPYLSLAVSPPYEKPQEQQTQRPTPRPQSRPDPLDSDIPF